MIPSRSVLEWNPSAICDELWYGHPNQLVQALRSRNLEKAEEIVLTAPAEQLVHTAFESSPLHLACASGIYEIAFLLIGRLTSEELATRDADHKSALDYAIDREHLDIAELLIAHLTSEHLADYHEVVGSYVHTALSNRNTELALRIVEQLDVVGVERLNACRVPLMHCLILGHFTFDPFFDDIVRKIFEKSSTAILMIRDAQGRSILQLLCQERRIDCLDVLVCEKISQLFCSPICYLEHCSIWGIAPEPSPESRRLFSDPYTMQFAVLYGDEALMRQCLFQVGQDFNAIDIAKNVASPLMVAILVKRESIALMLMNTTSIDDWTVNYNKNNGRMLIAKATEFGFHSVLKAIEQRRNK